jgi:hypothetical protein
VAILAAYTLRLRQLVEHQRASGRLPASVAPQPSQVLSAGRVFVRVLDAYRGFSQLARALPLQNGHYACDGSPPDGFEPRGVRGRLSFDRPDGFRANRGRRAR